MVQSEDVLEDFHLEIKDVNRVKLMEEKKGRRVNPCETNRWPKIKWEIRIDENFSVCLSTNISNRLRESLESFWGEFSIFFSWFSFINFQEVHHNGEFHPFQFTGWRFVMQTNEKNFSHCWRKLKSDENKVGIFFSIVAFQSQQTRKVTIAWLRDEKTKTLRWNFWGQKSKSWICLRIENFSRLVQVQLRKTSCQRS